MTKSGNSLVDNLKSIFKDRFGQQPEYIVRAPGRVNLIGEHTDYNGGFVFPAAIDREILLAASTTPNVKIPQINIYSCNYDQIDHFLLSDVRQARDTAWSNYFRGVVSVWQKNHGPLPSINAVVAGDIPQGAGLSSSAAYEVAVATLLNKMTQSTLLPKQIALVAQKAENDFVGVSCGIMDQFVSSLAAANSALLIDCRSLEYESIPLDLSKYGVSVVITHSGIERGLVTSEYNVRRSQCTTGVAILAKAMGRDNIGVLRDISPAEYVKYRHVLPRLIEKRCRHVMEENERVLLSAEHLKAGDITSLGALMNASHTSLKDNFEVSCPEIDLLVSLTQAHTGALGARMTGAGFGGCTVALMKTESVPAFISNVIPIYESRTNRKAQVYVCQISSGATVVESPILAGDAAAAVVHGVH